MIEQNKIFFGIVCLVKVVVILINTHTHNIDTKTIIGSFIIVIIGRVYPNKCGCHSRVLSTPLQYVLIFQIG